MGRKGLLGALALPVAVAAGVLVGLPKLLQRKFAPPKREQPHHPSDLGLDAEELWLTAIDGSRLRAWYIGRSRPSPVLIVLHGWGANASLMLPVAPAFHEGGYALLFIDVRSHGASDEVDHMSMFRFAQDLDTAIDWVRELPDVTGVGVLGHSVGAGAVILTASRRDDIDAVVAVGAFSHPWELVQQVPQMAALPGAAQWTILRTVERVGGFRMDDVAPRVRIGLVRCPLMLVHGANDEVISHEDFDELSRLSPPGSESLLVPGAVHDRLDEYVPELSHVLSFLAKHMHGPKE
ncbi:MAG: alpha/beta fold hydrolase [Acidimicrobiia bacterium]|nr:alpha/beta fold hydrolase [Acidimicrobiia bacterium]